MQHLANIIPVDMDSYKLTHNRQYPQNTETVYSYFEARTGARFPYTVFFGLQAVLKKHLVGRAVEWDDLRFANEFVREHMGEHNPFNYHGWLHILEHHQGRLPLRIKAVPEGTPVPVDNVLMTVENTCPQCFWLPNAMETLLTHVWYPSTVATLSHHTIWHKIRPWLLKSAESDAGLPYMLHDFGMRGATTMDSAAMGGMAHLINSLGTDTTVGMRAAMQYYAAPLKGLGYSVAATEHSVMTALGEAGEFDVVDHLLDTHPTGILSVVGDSYDIYRFVKTIGSPRYRDRILGRDGVFVTRPDSKTPKHPEPEDLVMWILNRLWEDFGGTINSLGFKVLDPHVRVIWGDGIDDEGIDRILATAVANGFSAENIVIGMGGGLHQKVNRDTQRFAFKAAAMQRDGEWHNVYKSTLDPSKASKRGKLMLVEMFDGLVTRPLDPDVRDVLETVFEDGQLVKQYTFDQVRENARQPVVAAV